MTRVVAFSVAFSVALAFALSFAACSDADTEVRTSRDASADVGLAGDAGHGDHGAACETIGRTGPADACLLFAYCGHRHFELDCAARFTCTCAEPEIDAGTTKDVVAQPIYCESAPAELRSAFDAARAACGW